MRVAPGSGAVLQGRPGLLDFENPKHMLNYSMHMLVTLRCMCWWLRDKKRGFGVPGRPRGWLEIQLGRAQRTQVLGPKAMINGQHTLINMLNRHIIVFNR